MLPIDAAIQSNLRETTTRVLAFRRGERLTVAANFTERPMSLLDTVPGIFENGPSLTDCIGNTPVDVGFVLAPWQMVWLNPTSS